MEKSQKMDSSWVGYFLHLSASAFLVREYVSVCHWAHSHGRQSLLSVSDILSLGLSLCPMQLGLLKMVVSVDDDDDNAADGNKFGEEMILMYCWWWYICLYVYIYMYWINY